MTGEPQSAVLYAVYCGHCELFEVLDGARACKCARREKAHIVCRTCVTRVDPENLGDLLVELQ